MKKVPAFFFLFSTCVFSLSAADGLTELRSFGDNPGNLSCFIHVPDSLASPAALVVSLHGCGENAMDCAKYTGWNDLADRYGFIVLYPQQKLVNNPNGCFDWFMPDDQQRGKGEPGSIAEMIRTTEKTYRIDTTKIFVSGLSAGAAMANILLSVYPDIFSKGAIFAGGPYGAAGNAPDAFSAMKGDVHKTPQEWGDNVRNADPAFHGAYPCILIFQGDKDRIVSPSNADELVKQWTNVHHTDTIADKTDTAFNGNPRVKNFIYLDSSGHAVVSFFLLTDFGHAIPVDPGKGKEQGGKTGLFAKDVDFYSIYYAAEFFGLTRG